MSGIDFLWWCATNFLGGRRISPIWARRRREMGVSRVRYGPQWANLVQAPKAPDPHDPRQFEPARVLNFQQLDDDIGTLRDAGLSVVLDLNGIAPYAVGGLTVYTEGVGGCLWWNDPNDANKGLHFTPSGNEGGIDRSRCSNPPDPSKAAIRSIAFDLVTRYPFLKMISFLNEPDDRISSAAIANQIDLRFGGNWTAASEWVTEAFLVPFYQGVKYSGIAVPVGGGEFSTPGFAAASIRWQQRTGTLAWDWDHTTHHLYATDAGTTAYDTLDAPGGWTAYFNELRDKDGIDIPQRLITETDVNHAIESPDDRINLIARLYSRGDIGAVTFLGDWFFKPESCADPDPMKNTYEPDESYGKVQKLMQLLADGKHRGVRT